MNAAASDTNPGAAVLVHQIRTEGERAARLMRNADQYAPVPIVVLRKGKLPSARNLLHRHKAHAYRLGNKGMFFMDNRTGQPYERVWTGKLPICVPVDYEQTEHRHLKMLLRRIRRIIDACS